MEIPALGLLARISGEGHGSDDAPLTKEENPWSLEPKKTFSYPRRGDTPAYEPHSVIVHPVIMPCCKKRTDAAIVRTMSYSFCHFTKGDPKGDTTERVCAFCTKVFDFDKVTRLPKIDPLRSSPRSSPPPNCYGRMWGW